MTIEEVKAILNQERNRAGEAKKIAAQLEKLRTRLFYAKASDVTLRSHNDDNLQVIAAEIIELEERQKQLAIPGIEFMRLINIIDDPVEWTIMFDYYSNRKSLTKISIDLSDWYFTDKRMIHKIKERLIKYIAKMVTNGDAL